MRSIYCFLLKSSNHLLSGFLFVLGFTLTGCNKEIPDMYGTPYAEYANHKIKGKVTGPAAKGIEKIRVEVIRVNEWPDTTLLKTDSNGEFLYEKMNYMEGDEYKLIFNKPPEQHDPRFETDSIGISFKDAAYRNGDKNWYKGEATQEVTIHLKEKKDE